jgi:L-iditol 2-dehydrogenase
MKTSRAAVVTAIGQPLEIQSIPIPELKSGALLVRIVASTLCGTDVHRWHGAFGAGESVPFITGHEPCGIVEAIEGPRTDILGAPVAVGDRIVWSYVSCGSCYYCSVAVQPSICPNRVSWGHNRSDQFPFLLGSVSEYMYVPPESLIVKVPEEVDSSWAAASACAYRTIMHGFDRLGAIKSHETILIQGSGPLGNFATAVAKDHGAKRVLVIGGPAARLEVAKRMGADAILDIAVVTDAKDRVRWVKEQTSGRGADVVVQVATSAATPEGLSALRPGGRFLNIGGGGGAAINAESLPREMTLYTVFSGEPRHWLQALDFLASRRNRFPFDEMITATYQLDQVNEAMEAMASFRVVKPVIVFA